MVAGGGTPPITPYRLGGQCIKRGGTRKRRKKRKRSRTKKNKKARKKFMKKYAHLISGLRRKQRGSNSRKTKGKRKTKRKRKRKTQKGGYSQYASNNPNTPGYSSPKPGPLPWATGPLSKSRQINCQNNYNHFTGRSSASPVTDRAAPRVPFGGTA